MKPPIHHEHDLGLQRDLERVAELRDRRRVLGYLLSSGAAAFAAACGGVSGHRADVSQAPVERRQRLERRWRQQLQ